MKTYKLLTASTKDGITLITIQRPDALNALSTAVFLELKVLLEDINTGRHQCLIITGEGKAFVAGADISEMVDMEPEAAALYSRRGQEVFNLIANLNAPVIAAINGFALGGGCELAMACDFRIASNKAKFGQPEVNLGLIPGFAGTQRFPRLVGQGNALYYLMTGEYFTAEEAFRMGLVQKVVEPEELLNEAYAIAKILLSKGPGALKKIKRVVRKGLAIGLEKGSDLETREFGSLFGNEGTEGMQAFLEKRNPKWNS